MIGFILALLSDDSVGTTGYSGGRDSSSPTARGPLGQEAFHQGREVLRADMAALRSGQPLTELAAPPVPGPYQARRRLAWRWLLLAFLVLWLLCTLLVASWTTGEGWDTDGVLATIASVLGWAMILLMGLIGALFCTVGVFLASSLVGDGRASSASDERQAALLRHDFWQQREALRRQVAGGTLSTEQLLTMLRGAGEGTPPLIAEMVRPTGQADR